MKDNLYAKQILSVHLVKKGVDDEDDQNCDIGVRLDNTFSFDPLMISVILSGVFDYCINMVPENLQNEFEDKVLQILPEVLSIRHEYTDDVKYRDV